MPPESYNMALGRDPAPGVVKKLTVQYRPADEDGEAAFAENTEVLMLLVPK